MGRDHAVECERCGTMYGGLNGPDECPCTIRPDSPGYSDRIAVCMHPEGPHEHVELKPGEQPPESCFADCGCKPRVYVVADEVEAVAREMREVASRAKRTAAGHLPAHANMLLDWADRIDAATPNREEKGDG